MAKEPPRFESLVNSDRCQTILLRGINVDSLRALLIRIGVKQSACVTALVECLRALLIRIGVKPEPCGLCSGSSLRALLIRIGVKLHYPAELYGKV